MKTTILLLLLCFGINSYASYFQTYCSNGEGTVNLLMGHSETSLTLTERNWADGVSTENKVDVPLFNVNIEYLEWTELDETSQSTCKDGFGYSTWETIQAKQIQITNKDGSTFNENTVDISKDKLSVDTYLICETIGNSQIACPKE